MAETLRALIVEDSEDDCLILVDELRQQGFSPAWERVQTGPAMKEAIERQDWDVVLADYNMPTFDGLRALQVLQESMLDIPFIVVSGTIGEDVAVKTMKAGAHDYLMKDKLTRLGEAIRREMRDAGIRRDHRLAIDKIKHLNRVLRAIRNVNQLIVREKDPARLVQQICDLLIETRGYIGARIATGDGRAPPASFAQAGWGERSASLAASLRKGQWPPCWKDSVASEGVIAIREPKEACAGCPLSGAYEDRAALVTALRHDGKVLGQLGVSIAGSFPPDEEEVSLLAEVAADVALALHTIEAERLHQESEARFRVITESSPDAIFLTDRMGNYTYVNAAVSELLGYSFDELTRMSIADLAVKERVQDYLQIFQELLVKGKLFVEIDLVRKDGTVVPVDLNAVLLPSGKVYGSCRDLTTRKQAEEALRRSETQHKLAQQVAHIGHWELDAYDGTPVWSDEVFRIFGLEPGTAEPSFTRHDTIIHPKEWPLLDQAVRAGFANGEPFDLVCRILRPDRQPGWIHAIGTATRDDQGKIVGMFGTAQDVTERKRTEDALRESRQLLEGILDSIPARVFWKDKNLVYLGCNAVFARDAGFASTRDVIGKDDYQMGWGDDQAELYRSNDREVIEQGVTKVLYEEPQTTPTGDTITLLTSKLPLRSATGEITGVLGTYMDITEHKQLQAQLAQSDRLSSMGMLAAGVAHEINNPLSYVLYNLESLTEDLPGLIGSVREFQAELESTDTGETSIRRAQLAQVTNPAMLEDILARFKDALGGTHRIRDIARGLGTFSRVEKDQAVPVNLMHVIDVALNMAFSEIKYRARLVKEYGRIPTIMASEGRLSQVFLNLLINATHAIDEGDVDNNEIRVKTWAEDDAVCAEVRDTGSGIAPENLGKLFEPFFTTKKVGVGSGLGLPISKSIVEGYKGTIQVSSEVGKGTSFIIRLPVWQEEAAVLETPSEATVAPCVKGRILIVDDEAGIRSAMARMLRDHETVQAANGAEAIAILEEDPSFDLVLCDMMMPEISGMNLHAWLAERQPQLAKQVIFITGGAFTPRARDYLSKVDNIRLEKPFDMANFKKIVGDRIHMAKGTRPE